MMKELLMMKKLLNASPVSVWLAHDLPVLQLVLLINASAPIFHSVRTPLTESRGLEFPVQPACVHPWRSEM